MFTVIPENTWEQIYPIASVLCILRFIQLLMLSLCKSRNIQLPQRAFYPFERKNKQIIHIQFLDFNEKKKLYFCFLMHSHAIISYLFSKHSRYYGINDCITLLFVQQQQQQQYFVCYLLLYHVEKLDMEYTGSDFRLWGYFIAQYHR